ncbi:MAG: phenylalanine--tRNA ligase subunit alpha, partial [Bacteroidetes bacterium]|nr:phenylalanine--tRNA ligase subunit alpha [Bacteroidota bacterium]
MQELQAQLRVFEAEIHSFDPKNAADVEAFRIRFLGTKGIVKQVLGEMKNVPVPQKKEAGQLLNAFKQLAEEKYASCQHLVSEVKMQDNHQDISLPGSDLPLGTRHPLRMIEKSIVGIFEKIGFS